MMIKTAELEGVALDWSVAVATEVELYYDGYMWTDSKRWRPTVFWDQCGPLIDKYRIRFVGAPSGCYRAHCPDHHVTADGKTHLIAACRAIVAAELGSEVDVPEEFLE